MSTTGDEFWAYSVRVYERPKVADCLIELQDRHGVDVNVVLFCCWCGWSGRPIPDAQAFAALLDAVSTWQSDVVGPLRQLRRQMKRGVANVPADTVQTIRGKVQGLEIDCERVEQEILATHAPSIVTTGSSEAARALLTQYFAVRGIDATTNLRASVDLLIEACSP